jgi:lipopolysaccharide transport system permease protein
VTAHAAGWARSLPPLVAADLRHRYAGSALGALWVVAAPALEAAVYWLVFGPLLGAAAHGTTPYFVLIASGLFPWAAFREAVEASASVFRDNRWIRRARVPPELLVARLVGAVAVALTSATPSGLLGWLSPAIALLVQLAFCYGLGLLIGPLAVLLPGARPTLVSLLTLLTFLSPILYPESLATGALGLAIACNPFTHLLRLYRGPLEPMATAAWLTSLAVAAGGAAAAVAAGRLALGRLWPRARDVL